MVDVLGTKLGRYEIRERLGKGGMAAVYKGWDTNLDRWVAVKVLHDHLVDETGFKARFEREAKVVASLSHPNIVGIFDFDTQEVNGTPLYYMVMPLITGKSLKELMDERHARGERLTMDEIENIMRGVAGALHYAHDRGMVHRDVTPSNILFNDQNQAVLADFGIARIVSDARLTQSGMTTGTPMYMPPEQGVGKAGDKRSDLYSVGVILYEMLAGQAPFNAESAIAVVLQHINDPVPSLRAKNESLSPAVEAVVLRALAKNPDERYQDANDFFADFANAIGGNPITAALPSAKTQTGANGSTISLVAAQITRFPWQFAFVGALLIIALLVIAVIAQRSSAASLKAGDNMTLAAAQDTKRSVPAMTSGPLIFTEDFGPDRRGLFWDITPQDPATYRNIENGVYHIRNTAAATASSAIFDQAHQYGSDFSYEADITISSKSQPDSAAGIIFRFIDDDNYYVFAVNGQGQVSLWLRSAGVWTELRKAKDGSTWTPFDGANSAGQINRLRLVDQGDHIHAYVNDKMAIDDDGEAAITSGAIGIYVATTSSRAPNPLADVTVDNFRVEYLGLGTPPAPESAATVAATSPATLSADGGEGSALHEAAEGKPSATP